MAKLNRQEQTKLNYMQNGGNMKQAMIDAGYSETYADRNSKYLLGIIGQEIKDEQNRIKADGIKSIEEIQKWWSANMDNEELDMTHRMKSSEMLAKSQGGFIDKVEASVSYEDNLKKVVGEDEY